MGEENKFEINDKVKLKGYKNEGRIIEILGDNYCIVEFDDIKMMEALVCGTLYFEFLEKVKNGEEKATHTEKRKLDELEKIK